MVEVVKVGMTLNGNKNKKLTSFAVPHICEPLSEQPVTLCLSICVIWI